METQKCEFFFSKSSKLTKLNSVRTSSFRMPRKKKTPWLRQYQSYISNWYVNGKVFTSTTTWKPKNLIFFLRKFEIVFDSYFDLCWRAEIIQVGLNMHLYVDIGDASSSLRGSTSSLYLVQGRKFNSWLELLFCNWKLHLNAGFFVMWGQRG